MTAVACRSGHELVGENLRVTPKGRGVCRACQATASRRSYEKRLQKPPRPCARCREAPRQRTGSYCRGCENVYQREWWAAGGRDSSKAERARRRRQELGQLSTSLKAKYGLSLAEFEAMVATQDGLCKICQRPPSGPRLVVDHDHSTGMVRGLLCQPCNAGIGMLQDDPDVALKAAAYLRMSGGGI